MPQILKTVADYAAALTALLPTGGAWPRAAASVEQQAMAALAPTPQRAAASAQALMTDAFPSTAVNLLAEWESTLGLPDPCAGEDPTVEARQDQVTARFIAGGGQSAAFFVSFAKALGYDITITQFVPSRFGRPFGSPFGGIPWAFTWQVNASSSSEGNAVLECELQRLAPAHTIVIFSYS